MGVLVSPVLGVISCVIVPTAFTMGKTSTAPESWVSNVWGSNVPLSMLPTEDGIGGFGFSPATAESADFTTECIIFLRDAEKKRSERVSARGRPAIRISNGL